MAAQNKAYVPKPVWQAHKLRIPLTLLK
jgi:hypothetical protein